MSAPVLDLPPALEEHATWLHPKVAVLATTARFPSANSLLVADGSATWLVDAGLGEAALRTLAPRLDGVVLTHFHLDHIIRVGALAGVPVVLNARELDLYDIRQAAWYDAVGLEAPDRERWERIAPPWPRVPDPAGTFEPGGALELGATRWDVLPAPGHSPGHVMLHEAGLGIAYTVDVEFSGLGPWYGWPHCDPGAFHDAVEAHRPVLLGADAVATSHSPPIVGDPARVARELDAFQASYRERDAALLDHLRDAGAAGATEEAMVDDVRLFYGRHLGNDPKVRYWCRVMTRKHLERLEGDGEVQRDGDVWHATG